MHPGLGHMVTSTVLKIGRSAIIPENELKLSAIRASGPGGQNVNKVATAIQLQFDVKNSEALSDEQKTRIMQYADRRIAAGGMVTIKAQRFRSQEKNRQDACRRLQELLTRATSRSRKRIATRPGRKAREKRLDDKARRAKTKRLRGKAYE